ncbi:HemD protein [Clostridiales bacterium PH28_bin88]|nr:HemD protein [Clostridiales bacterium PH28_bin88]
MNTEATKGKVYLVGAGPGDPKLITLKGLDCIRQSQVVVYDRLVSPKLLGYARPDAELIYVGKSPERHTLPQDEINQLLIIKAKEGLIVTRLKGGDPFVFGRGGEEAQALRQHGIPFEVVPGITAAVAVPAYAGIPVTHRDFSSSVYIVTGNEDPTKNDSMLAWDKIATGAGTLVFLMGMANLPHICQRLMEFGRDPQTPVALIRWGTRPEQRTLVGTLENVVERAQAAEFKHPVIIVVGEVVKLREQLQWFERKPLFGRRVVITRARTQAGEFAERIEALGGEAWEFPTIDIAPPTDFGPLDRAVQEVRQYNWIVFTSVNGVESFFDRLRQLEKDIRDLCGIRLCAIGPKTREALESYGLRIEYMPEEYVAEAVVEKFRSENMHGKRVLLPRADIARKLLPEALREMGAIVDEVVAYRTIKGRGDTQRLKEMLRGGSIHAVTFTSSSTARNFVDMLGREEAPSLLSGVTVACIGPITADTARAYGLPVHVIAEEYTIEGLTRALVEYFQSG